MLTVKDQILDVLYKNTLKQEKIILQAIKKNKSLSPEQKQLYLSSLPLFRKLYPKEVLYIQGCRISRSIQKEETNAPLPKYIEPKFNYFDEIIDKESKEKLDENFNSLYSKFKKKYYSKVARNYNDFRKFMIKLAKEQNNFTHGNVFKFFHNASKQKISYKDLFILRDISLEQYSDLTSTPENQTNDFRDIENNRNKKSRAFIHNVQKQKDFVFDTTDDNQLVVEFIINQYNLISILGYREKSLTLFKNKDYQNTILLANKISKELAKHSDRNKVKLLVDNFERSLKNIGIDLENNEYIKIDHEKIERFGRKNHIETIKEELYEAEFFANYVPVKTNSRAKEFFDAIYNQMKNYALTTCHEYANLGNDNSNFYEKERINTISDSEKEYSKDIQDFAKTSFYLFVNNAKSTHNNIILSPSKTNIPKKYRLMINEFAEQNPDINLAKEFSNYEYEINPNPQISQLLNDNNLARMYFSVDAMEIKKSNIKPEEFIQSLNGDFKSILGDDKNKIYHRRILGKIDTTKFEESISKFKDIPWKLAFDAYNIFQKGKDNYTYFSSADNNKEIQIALKKLDLARKLIEGRPIKDEERPLINGSNKKIKELMSKNKPRAIQRTLALPEMREAR